MWHFDILRIYTVAGKCTVDGKDNKEDKTREEADMTFSPFLAVQDSSIGDIVSQWVSESGHFWFQSLGSIK